LLDPQTTVFGHPEGVLPDVRSFLSEYYDEDEGAKIYSQICSMIARDPPFSSAMVWKSGQHSNNPISWRTVNFSVSAPELTALAERVLSMPSSSTSSERNWSAFNFIHSKSRNRLKSERVQKLVSVYWNTRLLRDIGDAGTFFEEEDFTAEGMFASFGFI